jgi:CelD/BcsL family acetyltransferase involved in cellulose biosynthesis
MTVALLGTDEPEAWRAALPSTRNAFGSVEFAQIHERHSDARAVLLHVLVDGAEVAYPLFAQPLPDHLGRLSPEPATRFSGCDLTTPPFTGPQVTGDLDASTRAVLAVVIAQELAALGAVTEFAHLHPWRARRDVLPAELQVTDREVVYVDLTMDEQQTWASMTAACRKNIRRAERSGVTVREAVSDEDVEHAHQMYLATMERLQALDRYRFPASYFEDFRRHMFPQTRFMLAERDGQLLAATLFVHDDEDVYSYLGGADQESQHLRPTNALIAETIRWARRQGKRRLILGGGYRPDDGIFRFKASFSPLRAELLLFRRVHDLPAYRALVAQWQRQHERSTSTFFPAYRSPSGS